MIWNVYGKSIAAFVMAVLTVLVAAMTDGHIRPDEWIQVAIAVTTGIAVYLAPNLPQYPAIKTAMAAVLAALNLAVSLISDGLSTAELINLVIAALAVVAVGATPARSDVPGTPAV